MTPSNSASYFFTQILWENRLEENRLDNYASDGSLISVGCFEFPIVDGTQNTGTLLIGIDEPYGIEPYKAKAEDFYSKKSAGPALRYEVATSIHSSDIVWISNPYPGGFSALTIFQDGLRDKLKEECESAEADDSYCRDNPLRGGPYVKCPATAKISWSEDPQCLKERVQMRNATISEKLKDFGVLNQMFRHDIGKNVHCFLAVAVIVQLAKEGGE